MGMIADQLGARLVALKAESDRLDAELEEARKEAARLVQETEELAVLAEQIAAWPEYN